ncbi:MAG: hypothetical protein AB1540_05155 [Bdellovibrionota bacterium]
MARYRCFSAIVAMFFGFTISTAFSRSGVESAPRNQPILKKQRNAKLPSKNATSSALPRATAKTPLPRIARSEAEVSPHKPKLEDLLKPKSIKRITDDGDVITNSDWLEDDDFAFVNGTLIKAPLRYARPKIMDFSLYPKMSSAIHKFDYDEATQTIELKGEAGGLTMHSWIKVDQSYWDEIRYEIIKGDMKGFKITAYLWENENKTLAVAKGVLPQGKRMFSSVIAVVFKPLSEVVIGVATKNFRSYIEEEYKKQKTN